MIKIETRVWVSVDEMVENNLDEFLDLLSDLAIGTVLLQDFTYHPVGLSDVGDIQFRVKGWVDDSELEEDEIEEIIQYAERIQRT